MNIPKIDIKPASSEKITLFANKAEAVVFWLSLAGLIFLAIISFSRYRGESRSVENKQFVRETQARLSRLEADNQALQVKLDSLALQIRQLGALEVQ